MTVERTPRELLQRILNGIPVRKQNRLDVRSLDDGTEHDIPVRKHIQMDEGDLDNSTELCVCCRADTGVRKSTPVDIRKHYVHGIGQVCVACFVAINSGDL